MDVSYSHYYRVNEYLLSSIGQWPFQTQLRKSLISTFVYFALISLLIPELIGLAKYWGDVDIVIECIPPIIIIMASLTLTTNCVCKMEKMELILSKIKKDWTFWSADPENEILHAYAKKGEIFSIAYASYIFSTTFAYLALPLVPQFLDIIIPLNESRGKKTLYPTEYYLDMEKYFYWILIHGYISSVICIVVLVSVDTIFMVVVQHACGILTILGYRLENLMKEEYKCSMKDKCKFNEEINRKIKLCVQIHLRITIFVNDICDCFSTSFFLVLGLNMIIMSVTGVQTVMKRDNLHEAMRFGAFTLGQMFHLFYLSVPCQQLIDHSINIPSYIYRGQWYQLSSKSQKLLPIIMTRSSKPCSFTSGKLYTFSMQNFASILRTSMSYFTVLSSVR